MKYGIAFPDYIKSKKRPFISRSSEKSERNDTRSFLLPFALFIFVSVLFFRLFSLQVIDGSHYLALSDSNRIRTTTIHAPRGVIFDRNGVPLVYNIPGFRQIVNGKTELLSRDSALKKLAKGQKGLEIDALRQYPEKDVFAHVVGYIGQINTTELQSEQYKNYQLGDLVGRMGVEEEYEHQLRGIDGRQLVEVDALGKPTRVIGVKEAIPGKNITLTLDRKMQEVAYQSLGTEKGAVVVSKPNGEILALVSKPSFDPNLFTLGSSYHTATDSAYPTISSALSDSKNQPFLNRAISGTYPPGSTFKLITAAAGLSQKIIDEHYQVQDNGILRVGDFSFANWYYTDYGKTDGMVDVVKAIKRSNDIFFYTLGNLVGVGRLSKEAVDFGLGAPTGIDLPGEAAGLVPTKEWKKKTIGEDWYLGDNYHYAIGQGYLLTTPIQVNLWTQAIANRGVEYRPYLLLGKKPVVSKSNLLNDKNFKLIRQGMIEACDTGGVAWPLFDFKVKNPNLKIDGKDILAVPQASGSADMKDYRKITIACKTGTAQHGGEKTLPHAWITLFAPAYHPQIVVTVLAESSGEGSNVAGPIAKKILEEWFGR